MMKHGKLVFLAIIRPTNQIKQGMTQKVKFQQMKETGESERLPWWRKHASGCVCTPQWKFVRNYNIC